MTLDGLDPVLSPHKRLAAIGIVAAAKTVEFSFIRSQLDLKDADLSKQLKALSDAGYITTKRTGRGTTRKTWVSITKQGSAALEAHAAALQELINPVAQPVTPAAPAVPATTDNVPGRHN